MKCNIFVSHHHAIEGMRIKHEIKLVRIERGFFRAFRSYNEALDELKENARKLGGDAVISIAFDEHRLWIEGFVVALEQSR
jgi:hypothetical protein